MSLLDSITPLEWRRLLGSKTAAGPASRTGMQTKWSSYYWNEMEVNSQGESLRQCMERYGVGGRYSEDKDMIAALVFLSVDKTAENSWVLGIKRRPNYMYGSPDPPTSGSAWRLRDRRVWRSWRRHSSYRTQHGGFAQVAARQEGEPALTRD